MALSQVLREWLRRDQLPKPIFGLQCHFYPLAHSTEAGDSGACFRILDMWRKKGRVGSKQYVTTPFRLVSYIYEKLSTGVTHLSLFTVALSALQKGKRTICHCRRFFLQGTLPPPKILSSFLHPISSPLLSGPAYTRIGWMIAGPTFISRSIEAKCANVFPTSDGILERVLSIGASPFFKSLLKSTLDKVHFNSLFHRHHNKIFWVARAFCAFVPLKYCTDVKRCGNQNGKSYVLISF